MSITLHTQPIHIGKYQVTSATRLTDRRAFQGLPILSAGFRPFFLGGALYAILAIGRWIAFSEGYADLPELLNPVGWHVHELLFGYVSAIIAGFLFTAVPNWTGRMPIAGWRLVLIALLWLAGRVALWLPFNGIIPPLIDMAFLPVLAAVIAREVLAGKNWRNIKVLAPVLLLAMANIGFHYEAAHFGTVDYSTRAGFTCIVFLLMLISGRIIPSFTRNWLAKQDAGKMPIPFSRFDAVCIVSTAVIMGIWSIQPTAIFVSVMLLAATVLNGIRLSRWAGIRTLRNPLLFVLHLFYGLIPFGLIFLSVNGFSEDHGYYIAGLHILGIGAIGGMTLSVMVRASLGHTGQPLVMGRGLYVAFVAIILATACRVALVFLPGMYFLMPASGLFWILAFALFALKVGPLLLAPRLQNDE